MKHQAITKNDASPNVAKPVVPTLYADAKQSQTTKHNAKTTYDGEHNANNIQNGSADAKTSPFGANNAEAIHSGNVDVIEFVHLSADADATQQFTDDVPILVGEVRFVSSSARCVDDAATTSSGVHNAAVFRSAIPAAETCPRT